MDRIRDLRLDGLKYVLICLVVLCHLMQGCRYDGSFFQAFYSVVYSFHMPLFVLLSGFFFHANTYKKVHFSNKKLIEPFIVWHFFVLFFYETLIVHQYDFKRYFIFEPSPLWYLISLIFWRWMTYCLDKAMGIKEMEFAWGGCPRTQFQKNGSSKMAEKVANIARNCVETNGNDAKVCLDSDTLHPKIPPMEFSDSLGGGKKLLLVILSVIISNLAFCLINDIDGCYFSLMRTFQFFPFFVLGHCITQRQMVLFQKKPIVLTLFALSVISIVLISHYAGPEYNAILFSKYGIKELQNILGTDFAATFWIRFTCFLMSLSLCLFLLSIFRCSHWVSNNGISTLFILCTHVLLYYVVRQISSIIITFTIAILTITVLTWLAKQKVSHWLLYPFSSFLSFLIK